MSASSLPPPSSTTPGWFGRGTIRICRRYESIIIVALDRPKVRNAFNSDVYLDLVDVLRLAEHDQSVAAVVLTGAGPFFSSGADLKSVKRNMSGEDHVKMLDQPTGQFMMTLIHFPKILAAAVNGPAVGIGVTLLMHCDLVICSNTASFWTPFTRLALVPELCSSATFPEAMGIPKANELLLLGRKIDAQTSVDWNICSRKIEIQNSDPFADDSLASFVCRELEELLLSLPLGDHTSQVFVSLVRGARSSRMRDICDTELAELDKRFWSGHVQQAAQHLQIGRSKL